MAAKCTGFNYCLWSKPYGKLAGEVAQNELDSFNDKTFQYFQL